MSTPSLQTFVTDASQVLNLSSISAVRSVVAVALANANAGTPLNPNLTTQQLWNEFYQVVTEPKSNIESFIANQMMKFFFSPPAPGGAGADKQVIFNDMGVLAGDTKFLWDKNANRLDVDGPVVITGDLTVDTNVLKVDTTNNRVGIGTASPAYILDISGASPRLRIRDNGTNSSLVDIENGAGSFLVGREDSTGSGGISGVPYAGIMYGQGAYPLIFGTNFTERYRIDATGVATWSVAGTTAMTLNSTGNLVLKGGTAAANGVGVTFPATQVASSDANTLDDYEEGTFTVTVGGTTTNGTATYAAQNGFYTKIGRLVQIQIYVSWSAGTATGNQTVLGLPFTSSGTGNNPSVLNTYAINIALTAGSSAASSISSNSSLINLFQLPTGGGADTSVPCDAAGTLIITGTYFV